jgi:hypothetical protein
MMEQTAVERFGAVVSGLDAELDWPRLGLAYCDGGGLDFFDEQQRGAIMDTGLLFASELGELLVAGGTSLYVGAGVAELVPICFEALVLGRSIVVATLPGFEVDELRRVMGQVSAEVGTELPQFVGVPLEELQDAGPFDHVWAASVLSDPEAFPALHDRLYERAEGADGATGSGDLVDDERRALGIVGAVLRRLAGAAILTTSDEELSLYGPALEQAGFELQVPDGGRISAIVGDVVRHVRVSRKGQ